ncbi:MAG: hypothetical protein HFH45_06600 [Bacilli bacterium]|nr:hypothetical protein [Bacilli bacterium]
MNLEKYKKLDKLMYALGISFFAIPLFIFLLGWYKLYISIPLCFLFVFIVFIFFKKLNYKTEEEYKQIFNWKKWGIVLALLIGFNLLSGIGGYFFQNWDHNARNAVLHDLIDYDFPVKYNYEDQTSIDIVGEEGYFSYYFSYWLPSSLVGKAFGFDAANLFLFIYQLIGLIVFYYFICRLFSKIKINYLLIFMAFSGLDIVGQYLMNPSKLDFTSHIDTWSMYFCTSSTITQLFWVFNQGISTWIIVSMLLNEKGFTNVGIYMLFIFLFAPFPAVGLFMVLLVLLVLGFYNFNGECSKTNILDNFKELFSKQNLLVLIIVLFIALFFLINPSGQPKGIIFSKYGFTFDILKKYIAFWLLEFGIIALLIMNKKNFKYIIGMLLILSIIPFFYIGHGLDFVNRVSLPVLMILALFTIERLNQFNLKKVSCYLIIVYLILSSMTGIFEINRTLQNTFNTGKYDIVKNRHDNWKSYGKLEGNEARFFASNFSTKYDRDNFIFKYILK